MRLSDLIPSLRPKAADASSLDKALADTEAGMVAIRARIKDMVARRAGVLLDAPPEEATAFEAELAAAKAEIERLDVVAAELRVRRDQARQTDLEASAKAAVDEAERLAQLAAAEIARRMSDAVLILAELVEHERVALVAVDAAAMATRAAGMSWTRPVLPLARLVGTTSQYRLRDLLAVPDVDSPWSQGYGGLKPEWTFHPQK